MSQLPDPTLAASVPLRGEGRVADGVSALSHAAGRSQRAIALIVVTVPFLGFLAAVALLWGRVVGALDLALLAVMVIATQLGVEVGLHRHLSHRSFKAKSPVRSALVILGSMAAQGPPLFWAATHRRHHAFSDREGDPHSPHSHGEGGWRGQVGGLWHAHVGWLFRPEATDWSRYTPDLLRDRRIFELNRRYPHWIALGLVLPAALGGLLGGSWQAALTGLLWGGLVRIFFVQHITWSVNSLCHTFGSRPFATRDRSYNNAWLALPSLGGSWHNNHHAFPGAATTRMMGWQLDPSGWFIAGLRRLGWAWEVKEVPAAHIAQAARSSLGPPSGAPSD